MVNHICLNCEKDNEECKKQDHILKEAVANGYRVVVYQCDDYVANMLHIANKTEKSSKYAT